LRISTGKYPPELRLRAPASFQHVWKTGRRVSVPLMAIMSCKNDLGHPRLGISIPKKNIRLAVDRNRFKRLAREAFRLRQNKLAAQDFVVVTYKGAEALTPIEQYQRVNALWDLAEARLIIP